MLLCGTGHFEDVFIRFHQEVGRQALAEADKNRRLYRGSWLKRSIPMKYCRYGFSWISFITARSESFFRFCMTSMPRAIRRGVAGWPVLEGNSAAYLISILSHGMACASLTHSFSGSSCIPQDWFKSNRVVWRFLRLSGIYMGFCTSKMQIF